MANSMKPAIRFKGFTDDWEQRKLGEVAQSFEYGLNSAAKEYDGINKYLRITNIDDASRKFKTDNLTSPDIELETAGNYRLDDGDILFARTGASVGKSYIYRTLDGIVYFAGFLIRARIKPECYAEFVFQNTLSESYGKYIQVTSQRSGQPGVNAQEYADYEFYLPTYDEQYKIGVFLRSLDNLITLHQRKCDLLKNTKKSLLEKMFPKNDSLYPEVRFKGFTDAWEQRKAMDIADYSKGNGYSKSDLVDIGTPIILYGRLYTKYQFAISEVDTFAIPKDGSVYSQGNEVIIPASGETAEDIARASAIEKSGVLLGGDLNILRPFSFINPLFLALAISSGEPQKELAKKAQGKSVVHIHNSDIQEVSMFVSNKSRTRPDCCCIS